LLLVVDCRLSKLCSRGFLEKFACFAGVRHQGRGVNHE
jgi:hypothetical protein